MLRYAFAIFLGAFLLFLVQPLIGRFILPWFGGGPGVWTTCMLFFQVLLLGGYAYAHFIVTKTPPRWQMIIHVCLLLAAAAFLPIVPSETWRPVADAGEASADPTRRILLLLVVTLGVPYVVLSATGPLLQAWFARAQPGRSPYRLYALSNVGSLLALVAYPFVVEPAMSRRVQAVAWSMGFGAFALVCGWCAISALRGGTASMTTAGEQSWDRSHPNAVPAVSRSHRIMWVLLPMCASIMLLAVTNKITQDIAPVPFLWILPLAIYLITFIICFDRPAWYCRPVFVGLIVAVLWLLAASMQLEFMPIRTTVALYALVLLACGMVCHGELYRLRPTTGGKESSSGLTTYYLAIALGGALGGGFVTIIAPLLFNDYWEFQIGLYGSVALLIIAMFMDPASLWHRGRSRPQWLVTILAVAGAAYVMSSRIFEQMKDLQSQSRNFYGVLSVRMSAPGQPSEILRLQHGSINHGAQFVLPKARLLPTLYYGPRTGVGLLLLKTPKEGPRSIGAIGLGVGTLAAYGRHDMGDTIRFYEINPQVKQIAEQVFAYLSDSPAKAEIVLGDARLSLEREPPQHFDVLVLDAFNGDAIPTHLLTMEAFDIYERHMQPEGVIAVHVTNNYLNLRRVMARLAKERGFLMLSIDTPDDPGNLVLRSMWVLLTRNRQVLEIPEIAQAAEAPDAAERDVALWIDDRINLFEILR